MGPTLSSTNQIGFLLSMTADTEGAAQTDAALKGVGESATATSGEVTASMDKMDESIAGTAEGFTALGDTAETQTGRMVASNEELDASNEEMAAQTDDLTALIVAAYKARSDALEASVTKQAALNDMMNESSASSDLVSGASSKAGLAGALANPYVVAGAAIAGAVALSVKSASDFQQSLTRLVTSAGESENNLQMVGNGILSVARSTGTGVTQLTQAMYTIESGGQHGAAGLDVLKAAAQGAKTENANLVTVADAVTSAMTDYHLSAGQAADVTSKLVAATGQGKTTFQDLAGAMSALLPKASAAGISLNEILGDLASMTLHGISAQQAAENMADAISHLQSPTMAMSKELAALGLNSTQLSQSLGKNGLYGTITDISQAIQKQMGPGTTAVVLDMENALKGLPQSAQDLSQQVINGTATWQQWNVATKDLTVTQRSQAQAFATLYNGMHTIGTEQMSGAQVMQTYAGAMNKAMGDSAGLNVALMLTGQNSGNTSRAIQAVSSATADASGNVKGWSDIENNFNQQMSISKEIILTTATAVGEKLLPALTDQAKALNDLVPNTKALWDYFSSDTGPLAESTAEKAKKASDSWNQWATSMNFATGAEQNLTGATKAQQQAASKLVTDQTVLKNLQQESQAAAEAYGKAQDKLNQDMAKQPGNAQLIAADQQKLNSLASTSAGLLNAQAVQQELVNRDNETARKDYNNLVAATDIYNKDLNLQKNGLQAINDQIATLQSHQNVDVVATLKIGTQLTGIKLGSTTVSQGTTELNLIDALYGGGLSSKALQGSTSVSANVQMSGSLQGGSGLQMHATGTNYAPGGPTILGENGPEAVILPTGSQVKTAAQTQSMAASGGGGAGNGVTLYQTNYNYSLFDQETANRKLGFMLASAGAA